MECVKLKDLREDNECWAVKVRVCRLWESFNQKKNGELISLDIVFIDEMGTLMATTIRRNLVSKFKHLLKEGLVYTVKNFKVVLNYGEYRVVNSKFKIVFTLLTTVKKVEDKTLSIPMHGFQFVNQQIVNTRVNDDNILTDIVGCLTKIGDLEIVGGGFRKRDLEIISDYSVSCKLTLSGGLGEKFMDEHPIEKENGPSIIIVTSVRIKKFQGVVNFSTSSASKIYLNLKNEYVSTLAERFATVCPRVTMLEASFVNKKSLEEEMFENKMNIQQLLMAEWMDKTKGYPITILGVIEKIEKQHGWFYLGCKSCCRKITLIDGVYTCGPPCNTESENALTLFKIHLSVRDDTGITTCVVFQKNVERMVDSSALKLLNKCTPNSAEFPSEITALCGQTFVFRLTLSDYNIKHGTYGSDNFTVNKVFDPEYTLEKKYKEIVEAKENEKAGNLRSSYEEYGQSSNNNNASPLVDQLAGDVGNQDSTPTTKMAMRKRKFVVVGASVSTSLCVLMFPNKTKLVVILTSLFYVQEFNL